MRLIAIFNLKPGIDRAAYEAWARDSDLPTVNALPSIDRFEVFRTTGVLGVDTTPPCAYIEIIDVNDMDRFGADCATEAMVKLAAQFQQLADVIFLTTEPVA